MSDDTERRVEKWEMGRMENVDMSALEGLTFELPDGTVIITAAADEPTDGLEEVQVCKSAFVSNWSTIYTHFLLKSGLEIGHFEKKTQGEKNSKLKKNNSRKKLKVSANFCRVVVQNHVFCY